MIWEKHGQKKSVCVCVYVCMCMRVCEGACVGVWVGWVGGWDGWGGWVGARLPVGGWGGCGREEKKRERGREEEREKKGDIPFRRTRLMSPDWPSNVQREGRENDISVCKWIFA